MLQAFGLPGILMVYLGILMQGTSITQDSAEIKRNNPVQLLCEHCL